MKKCPYCGKQYSDEYSVCAIDESPLEFRDSNPSSSHGTSMVRRARTCSATTQLTKASWISGACVIGTIAFLFNLSGASGISGGYGVIAILAGLMAAKVILFVADVAFIVQGFRVHWGWGLANTILGPLAGVVFFANHRQEGRVPIYILAHGLILLLVLVICAII